MASKTIYAAGESSFDSILALASTLQDQHRQTVNLYAPIVQQVIESHSRDIRKIEQALDRLLDCACIPGGLDLFKALCSHYFILNPVNTAYYVHAYREMWDNEADQKQGAA